MSPATRARTPRTAIVVRDWGTQTPSWDEWIQYTDETWPYLWRTIICQDGKNDRPGKTAHATRAAAQAEANRINARG